MAYITGTATDYLNLIDVIKDFVTDSVQMGADDVWELLADRSSTERTGEREVWLKAPGTSNVPAYVGIQSYADSGNDIYNLEFRVAQNFNVGASYPNQLDTSPRSMLSLRNDTIPYWIIANRRNVRVVARVGTVYQTGYFGFMLPYALPSQWPDALVCAGTHGVLGRRYSSELDNHRYLANPEGSGYNIRIVGGGWVNVDNSSSTTRRVWPVRHFWRSNRTIVGNLRNESLQDRSLFPLILWNTDSSNPSVYGELEGCYWVPGESFASEDELTIGGDTYLAVQDIFRTSTDDYMVVKLA